MDSFILAAFCVSPHLSFPLSSSRHHSSGVRPSRPSHAPALGFISHSFGQPEAPTAMPEFHRIPSACLLSVREIARDFTLRSGPQQLPRRIRWPETSTFVRCLFKKNCTMSGVKRRCPLLHVFCIRLRPLRERIASVREMLIITRTGSGRQLAFLMSHRPRNCQTSGSHSTCRVSADCPVSSLVWSAVALRPH